jgi:hypothetical protein
MRPIATAAALLLAVSATAFAQEPAASLDWLHGEWAGTGTVQGAPSEATLVVSPALEGRFVELRYGFTTQGERRFRFEGRGFYRAEASGWRGQWFDSTGATRPLSGTVAGATLTTEWGEAATERGRTTYRLEPPNALEVTDEVLRGDGRWHVFARHRMTRI